MISCVNFIRAYNQIFTFIERDKGYDEVKKLWHFLRENRHQELDRLLSEKGVRGAYEYWSRTLKEETAGFSLDFDEENEAITVSIDQCPSVKRAVASPAGYYHRYCDHCPEMYIYLAEKNNLKCDYRIIDRIKGICSFTIRK